MVLNCPMMTPLQTKIVAALTAAQNDRLGYNDLMYKVWPPAEHPNAWRYENCCWINH